MSYAFTDIPINIIGNHGLWTANHEPDSVSGPSLLTFNSIPIFNHCECELGDLSDNVALIDSVKEWRKGTILHLKRQGHFPFGSGTKLIQAYRYYNSSLRITTDFVIPGHTSIAKQIGISSFSIPGKWHGFREITRNNGILPEVSSLNQLPASSSKSAEIKSWGTHPVSLIFKHETGIELEIGLGTDIWRWNNGFLINDNNAKYRLAIIDNEIRFQRYVSIADADIIPEPRHYIFNWYLAWSMSQNDDQSDPLSHIELNYNEQQELDLCQLDNDTRNLPLNYALNLDLGKINWRLSQKRIYDNEISDSPCFTASSTIKHLKRIIRQISSLKNDKIPINITGIFPGFCNCGRHVYKKHSCVHWDMASIIEFAAWTRKILGKKRRIIFDYSKFNTPGMQQLFSESKIDYGLTGTI